MPSCRVRIASKSWSLGHINFINPGWSERPKTHHREKNSVRQIYSDRGPYNAMKWRPSQMLTYFCGLPWILITSSNYRLTSNHLKRHASVIPKQGCKNCFPPTQSGSLSLGILQRFHDKWESSRMLMEQKNYTDVSVAWQDVFYRFIFKLDYDLESQKWKKTDRKIIR